MKTKNNYLITGVSLIPDRDENTLFYARKLADLLSLKLRLVHTLNINEVQPWVNFAGYPPVSYVDQSESWEKIRSDANDREPSQADQHPKERGSPRFGLSDVDRRRRSEHVVWERSRRFASGAYDSGRAPADLVAPIA